MSALTIRTMAVDDIDDVLAIERVSASQPWTAGNFRDELAQPDTRAYSTATLDGEIVGFVGLLIVVGEGHITNIAVAPEGRGHGYGTRLMLHATRQAIARGCQAMTLEVRVGNAAARQLYARFGYAPAGVRKGYYADNGEDALVLWANDVDTASYGVRLAQIAARVTGAVG